MNPPDQLQLWLQNEKSKALFDALCAKPCFASFLSRNNITFEDIDDSHNELVLRWAANNKTFYLRATPYHYHYTVYWGRNDGKGGFNDDLEIVLQMLQTQMDEK